MLSNPKKLVISIIKANSKIVEELSYVLKPYDISIQQFNVLRILRGQRGVAANLSTVQDRMVNKMSNTTRLIDKLINKKYVKRYACKQNRRKIELFITSDGLSILNKLDLEIDKAEAFVAKNLSTDEQDKLNNLLKLINL